LSGVLRWAFPKKKKKKKKKSWFIKMFYIYCVYKMLWARVKNETAKNIKYRKWKQ
jgi:hypothetical protein